MLYCYSNNNSYHPLLSSFPPTYFIHDPVCCALKQEGPNLFKAARQNCGLQHNENAR